MRILSREELKMEVKKYKNISLRIIKELQKTGGKVPGYANTLAKEADEPEGIEGVKKLKSSNHSDENFEADSMFDIQSELPDEVPEKVQARLDKQEDEIVKLSMDVKVKNEKILDLLSELEEIKIQVFARDKSIELQQKQIEDLLEELRELKGLENDVKIYMQKKTALQDENDRLRDELNQQIMQGAGEMEEQNDLVLINKGLSQEIEELQRKVKDATKTKQEDVKRLKNEASELKERIENQNRDFNNKDSAIEQVTQ